MTEKVTGPGLLSCPDLSRQTKTNPPWTVYERQPTSEKSTHIQHKEKHMNHPLEALRQFAPLIGAALLLLGCLPTLAIGLTALGLFRRVTRHFTTEVKRLEAGPEAGQPDERRTDCKYQYGTITVNAAGNYTRGGVLVRCRRCNEPIARNAFVQAGLDIPNSTMLRYAPFCASCTELQNHD
jgi:hypothetical protein